MARYYLNLCEGGDWTRDLEGQDLAGLAEIRRAAVQRARAVIAEDMKTGVRVKRDSFVAAVDPNGEEVLRVNFADLLKTR